MIQMHRHWGDSEPTNVGISTGGGLYYTCNGMQEAKAIREHESKEARIQRIAKEKMLASFRIYNLKTFKIIDVRQHAKPQHRMYSYRR